jgi:hypothetical protein
MNKEFVNYEIALALKELGFDEKCLARYTIVPEDNIDYFAISEQCINHGKQLYGGDKNYNSKIYTDEGCVSAPLKSQVFKFFRDKYDADVVTQPQVVGYYTKILIKNKSVFDIIAPYEEAENAAIDKLIEIAKQQDNE